MPTEVAVRPYLRAAWRLAAVVVAVVLLVVVSVAGVRAWNAGVGLNVQFDTLPDALPDASQSPSPAATDGSAPAPWRARGVVPGAALTGPQNILVLGIDVQGALAHATGVPDPSRTNPPETVTPESLRSINLINLPAARTSVSVLSILPDTAVAGTQTGTVTPRQALESGGVGAAAESVADLLDVRIHRVAAVDVRALEVMADKLGGLDAASLGATFPNKTARPGGGERLSGVEVRRLLSPPDAGGPDAATGRASGAAAPAGVEHGVVTALLAACERNGTFASLRETGELAQAMAPYIAVDEGLTIGYLSSIDLALRDPTSDVRFGTLPTAPGSLTAAHAAPDEVVLVAVRQALASDSLAAYLRTSLMPPD